MVYLTTVNDVRGAIAQYSEARTLWIDTEVADYDTKQPRLSLIQISDHSTDITGKQVTLLDVLDQPDLITELIGEIMQNPKIEKIFHNAKYDLNFLGKRKAKNVTCTLEMVQNIPYYLVPLPNFQLKTLAEELCYFPNVSKAEQKSDWGQRPLSPQQLDYARMDVVYLTHVHLRLLQIQQQVHPDPHTEDINSLIFRYRQIETQWKRLDTEVSHIKDRLKAAMQVQNTEERQGFKLSTQSRNTQKVSFNELAKLAQELELDLDLDITLTKALQSKLEKVLDQLPIQETEKVIHQLRVSEDTSDLDIF
jgi:ribonuclease D